MDDYCVNKNVQTNGDHEVHKSGCVYWPAPANVQLLGQHSSCASAVRAARGYFTQVNGCKTCSMNRPGFELTPRSWTNFKGSHGEVRNKVQAQGC